jgi:hypothetical protein
MELLMRKKTVNHKTQNVFGIKNSQQLILLLALFLPFFVMSLLQRQTITQHAETSDAPTTTTLSTEPKAAGSTNVTVLLSLHGIGLIGDSTNPTNNTMSNKTPKQPTRLLALTLVDSNGQTVAETTGSVTYDPTAGDFRGTLNLGSKFTPGSYTVKVKMQKYLVKRVAANFTISGNAINTLPAAELIVGDVDGNNILDIKDYNSLLSCLDKDGQQSSCQGKKRVTADLNDDGIIGIEDINLFLRESSVRSGD